MRWTEIKKELYLETNGICPYCFCNLLSEEDEKRIITEPRLVDPERKHFSEPFWTNDMFIPKDLEKHKAAQIDHIIPVSKQGQNKLDNKIICCIDCNMHKAAKKIKLNKKQLIKKLYVKRRT